MNRRHHEDRIPPWARTIGLAVLAAVVLIGAIFALAAFRRAQAKQRFEDADSPELAAAARAFAKRGDSLSCEDEAVNRMNACHLSAKDSSDGRFYSRLDERREALDTCAMEVLHFHRHCLEAAPKSKGFCIRHKGHGMSEEKLFEARCRRAGLLPDFRCIVVVAESIDHCTSPPP